MMSDPLISSWICNLLQIHAELRTSACLDGSTSVINEQKPLIHQNLQITFPSCHAWKNNSTHTQLNRNGSRQQTKAHNKAGLICAGKGNQRLLISEQQLPLYGALYH